jgi:hypothetical protein
MCANESQDEARSDRKRGVRALRFGKESGKSQVRLDHGKLQGGAVTLGADPLLPRGHLLCLKPFENWEPAFTSGCWLGPTHTEVPSYLTR